MNKNFTAMVFTFNEERRLPFIYENLKGFCNIVVFDGGSTDGTQEYCKNNNISFIKRPKSDEFDENGSNMLKWVYEQVSTEYVLHVYCSHFFPAELLNQFSEIAKENKLKAVYHDVVVYRYGAIVHRPAIRRIASACVFYRKSIITFEKSKIHDELAIQFDENHMVRLEGRDELSLHLFQEYDCVSFTNKTIVYVATEASQQHKQGSTSGSLLFMPLMRFLYSYFRAGSFLRGKQGLIYALLNLIYDIQKRIVIWELCHDLKLDGVWRENDRVRATLNKKAREALK